MDPRMRQTLVLMKGHPGCGKSTISRALARALRCPVVDKDDIRDATLCLEAEDKPAPPAPTVLNKLSYDVMWRIVETQLEIGLNVIVDCPLARVSLFQIAKRLAKLYDCKLVIVECVANDSEEWKRRLEARAKAQAKYSFPIFVDETCIRDVEDQSSKSPNLGEVQLMMHSAYESYSGEDNGSDGGQTHKIEQLVYTKREERGPEKDAGVNMESFTSSGEENLLRKGHKPSLWEDVEKLLLGYANCYEYDTGLARKIVVDTTSLSTKAAVDGICDWLRCLHETSVDDVPILR